MKKKTKVTPGSNTSFPAELDKLSEYDFEELCCAIFDSFPNIQTADLFGIRGQRQYGIDIKADRADGAIEVGQCKCYQDFPPKKIQDAADEFIKHWHIYWATKNVKKFILFVSCDLSSRQRQEKIETIKKDFKKYGLAFEAWSNRVIERKLKHHPELVSRYFEPADWWVKKICGQQLEPFQESGISSITQDLFIQTINEYVDKDIKEIGELYKKGKNKSALSLIDGMRRKRDKWEAFSNENKAKILRIKANILLYDKGGVEKAENLAEEADKYYKPEGVSQLRTIIRWIKDGPQEAYSDIENVSDDNFSSLKGVLLASLGRMDDLKILLSNFPRDEENRAEYFRLKSMVSLHDGDLEEALENIEEALKIFPKGKLYLECKASLLYYSSVSPALVPKFVYEYPEPVDWILVKKDNDSVKCLSDASEIFSYLLANCDVSDRERFAWQSWKLGCLSCSTEKLEEAEQYCRSLLVDNRYHAMAVAWATSRGFLDAKFLDRSRKGLENLVEDGKASVTQILALCALYLGKDKRTNVEVILDKSKSMFKASDSLALWSYWKMQVSDKEISTENELSDDVDDERQKLLLLLSEEDGDKKISSIQEMGVSLLNNEMPLEALVDVTRFLYSRGQFDFIVENAEVLCRKIATSNFVGLVVNACASRGAFAKVTKILDQNKEYFPKAELPLDLRRLNLHAKDMTGDLPDALIEAKQLAQSTQDIQDHLGYTDLLMKQGNIKEAAKAVHYLSTIQILPAQHALRFSKIFSSDNPDLAKSLLKKAAASELTTSEKASAYLLGLQLGIGDELDTHFSQFIPDLAKGAVPGVQVKSVDEMLELIAENQRHAEYLEKMYFEGKAPIHTIVEGSNKSLASLYHNNTEINEHAGTLSPSTYPLFARHGGRGIPTSFPNAIKDWNLAMDVTALLLSTHLGLLNTIEENFKPIHISPETMYLLHKMKADVSSMQPDRIEAARSVIKTYRVDKIYLVDGFINAEDPSFEIWREEKKAKYLTWSQTVREESSNSGVSINCKQVLDLLLGNGAVSKIDYEKFLETLGAEGEILSSTIPTYEDVRSIYCENGVLIEVARSGFIEQLTSELDVYISSDFLASCENSVEADESATNFAGWIGALRDRISQGIEAGQYKVLPSTEYGEVREHELESASLKSLLLISDEEQYIVWIDDRMVNGHLTAGRHHIACCHDVLKALLHYNKISLNEYFQFLMKLRRGNVRFVPIEEDEILYQLSQAPEKDGEIRETPQLRILRQYLAGCYIEKSGFLKKDEDSNSPMPDGELPFMVQHHKAVSAAVLEIWKNSEKTIDRKISESKWVVDNMFFEQISIFPAWVQTEYDHRKLVSVRLASFLINAIQLIDGKSNDSESLKRDYADWICPYILERRLESDPSLLPVLSDTLAGFLCSAFLSIDKDDPEIDLSDPEILGAVKAELRRHIHLYPETLRKAIFEDKRIKENLQDNDPSEQLISIGEYYFKVEQFNDVLSQVVLGKDVNIKTWDDEYEFVVSLEKKSEVENVSFLFNCLVSNEKSFRLLSVENSAFLPTVTDRVDSISPRYMSFDLSKNDLIDMLKIKMNEEDVSSRVSVIRDLVDGSMVSYYDNLANDLTENKRFSFSELIPANCENLFHYFRFGANISIPDGLGVSAKRLIDDYGILTALYRLSSVPCEMPQQIIKCLDILNDGERLAIFSDWKKKVFSPLSLSHFVRLASKYDTPALNELVVKMYESYLTDPDLEIINSTFLSILR